MSGGARARAKVHWLVVWLTVAGQHGGMNHKDLRVLGLSALDLLDGSYSDAEVAATFRDLDPAGGRLTFSG